MVFVRMIGRGFVFVGLLFAILGAGLWIYGADITLSAGKLWYDLDSASLNTVQALIQRYIHPGLWDSVVVPLINRPAWEAFAILVLVFTLVGGLMSSAGRRRRRRYFEK
ncbi:MAG: hypothetical protein O2912_05835 [Proteobacteria bacterium]|nr:hypothetical protein [Pseudomonadota bacterium]